MYALSATSNRSTENPLERVKSKRKVDTKQKNTREPRRFINVNDFVLTLENTIDFKTNKRLK